MAWKSLAILFNILYDMLVRVFYILQLYILSVGGLWIDLKNNN